MCGRYRLSRRKQIIEEHFDAISGEEDWSPRFNVAPTQPIPIIRQRPTFAGLWDRWKDTSGSWIKTCSTRRADVPSTLVKSRTRVETELLSTLRED
jgi:putative SOS response-associated peptidase YedK